MSHLEAAERAGRARVKICGITRPEDARRAAAVGADAIGLVFYPRSARAVSIARAQAIVAALPPFVSPVAVFLDNEPALVREVLGAVRVSLLQFHGDEPPELCEQYGWPYMKAVRVREGVDVLGYARRYRGASAFLLDTYHALVPGGTGVRFDWSLVPHELGRPVILAGGLTPDNVREALEQVKPYGVDVSTGVEKAPGVKDAAKMAAFMRGVSRVPAAETQS